MGTRVLLIIDMYYITFIIIATLQSLMRGDINLALLNQLPILFLLHTNIAEVILLLVLFSKSVVPIIYSTWFWICETTRLTFNRLSIESYIFNPPFM